MRYFANGIDWEFEVEADGWVSIYRLEYGCERIPHIQAKDIEHAKSYCNFFERINVPFRSINDDDCGNILCLFGE